MGVIGEAVITILPDTGGFASKLSKDVKEASDKATEETSGGFQKLASVGGAALAGIGTGFAAVATESVHLADTFEVSHARLEAAIKASGGNYEDYAKQITTADKTNEKFGLTADQTEGALARLTQATNDPKKAMADLGLTVNIAAARHIDLESAATLVGKVAEGNTSVLKRYGISIDVAKGSAQDLTKAHEAVQKATENLNLVEEKVKDGRLKGASASDALKAAHEKLAEANDKVTAASSASGTAIEALSQRFGGSAAAQAETFKGKINAVEAQAKDLGIQFGLVLIPIIERVVSVIYDGVQWFEKHRAIAEILGGVIGVVLVAAIGAYIASMVAAAAATVAGMAPIIAIVAGVAALAAGVIYAYEHWDAFHDAVQKVIDVVVNIKDAIADFISGFTKGTDEIGSAQTTWAQWGAVAYEWFTKVRDAIQPVVEWLGDHLKPILEIVGIALFTVATGGIGPLIVGLVMLYEKSQLVRDIVEALGNVLIDVLKGSFETVKLVIENTIDTIKLVIRVVTDLVDIVKDIFTGKWGDAWDKFKDIPAAIIDYVKGIFGNFLGWFKTVPGLVIDALGNLLPVLYDAGKDLLQGLWEGAKFVFTNMADWLMAIPAKQLELIGDLSKVLYDAGKAVIGGLINGMTAEWSAVSGFFVSLVTSIPQWVGDLGHLIYEHGKATVRGFIDGLSSLWNDVSGFFSGLVMSIPRWLTNFGGDMGRLIYSLGADVVRGFINGLSSLWGDVSQFFASLVYSIPRWLTNFGGAMDRLIWNLGADVVRGFINGLVSLWGSVSGFFGALVYSIPLWLGDVGGLLWDAGRSIVWGLIHGFESVFDDVKNTLGDLAKKIVSWKGPPGVDATLLHSNGALIIGGLVAGMQSKSGAVKAFLSGMGATIADGIGGLGPDLSFGLSATTGPAGGSQPMALSVNVDLRGATVTHDSMEMLKDTVASGVADALEAADRKTDAL